MIYNKINKLVCRSYRFESRAPRTSLNIALSSRYWFIGILIANTLSIVMSNLWASIPGETKEMIGMTMFILAVLLTVAASEELVKLVKRLI